MKILFITQSVNYEAGVVSFVRDWIEESRKHFDKVTVFALRSSVDNVVSFQSSNKLLTVLKLNYLIIKYRNEYDVIFCHYSALWADVIFIVAKLFRKKIYQWWAHGKKNMPLVINEKVVDKIFTPSFHSNPINGSAKVVYTGHGIRTAQIKKEIHEQTNQFRLVSVGRLTKVKNVDVIVREFVQLLNQDSTTEYSLTLIGPAITADDKQYCETIFAKIPSFIRQKIFLIPNIPNEKIYDVICSYDGFINAQEDGGEGKAVLESMSVGLPTFFHTKCYENKLKSETISVLQFNVKAHGSLAAKILKYKNLTLNDKNHISLDLIRFADANHSIGGLWQQISNIIKNEKNKY